MFIVKSELVNFGLMINCFSLDRPEQNIIRLVWVWAIKFTILQLSPGWGKDNGALRVRMPKTLALQDFSVNAGHTWSSGKVQDS